MALMKNKNVFFSPPLIFVWWKADIVVYYSKKGFFNCVFVV